MASGSPCTLDKVPDACLAAVSMCGSAAAMRSPAPFLAASHAGPAPSYTAACAFASIRRSCPNQPTPQARRVESTPQQGTRSAIRLRYLFVLWNDSCAWLQFVDVWVTRRLRQCHRRWHLATTKSERRWKHSSTFVIISNQGETCRRHASPMEHTPSINSGQQRGRGSTHQGEPTDSSSQKLVGHTHQGEPADFFPKA
eukprot:1195879-Prorocentrum_minimum.AAC.1